MFVSRVVQITQSVVAHNDFTSDDITNNTKDTVFSYNTIFSVLYALYCIFFRNTYKDRH